MAEYPSRGISEPELREKFRRSLKTFKEADREAHIYEDTLDFLDEAHKSKQRISLIRRRIITENFQQYLQKRTNVRDAYIEMKTYYDLYVKFFPEGEISTNPAFKEFMEGPNLKHTASLDGIMQAIVEEESRKLEK